MKITQFHKWLTFLILFLVFWFVLKSQNQNHFVVFLPIYAIIAFGLYSLGFIFWRVTHFPTCDDATEKLREDIKEAEEDLKKRGYKPPQKKKEK
ncbi:dolichol-phosphate mannosyltransferase subunit [Anaeramoeba flamelloides]|uniref:Dolichol-phosphate mannosyltransferase subunit 3 n=1 Tax=Anaeramoeba flamelloides TaxID=1746091 RepID=A0AAV7Z4Y6_9EUKA|nr:dolichol-phosphate mannosyltransferase subunit [Anaeramoeba flamelloides]